jgi:hypothetical protein
VKARTVKGIDPAAPLADGAERIVRVRLDELCGFMPTAADAREVVALHDMRIAAKRLRYVLELAEPVLGKPAARGAREAKALQTLLGEIHDCDEMLPRIEEHARRLGAEDAFSVRTAAGARAKDLDSGLVRDAPHRRRYRGLASLAIHTRARRALLYERFVARWSKLERDGFPEQLLRGIEVEVG